MATWAKVKFFWETMLGSPGSTLTASSTTAGGYGVEQIHNMLETNMWMASTSSGPHYLSYDAGAGNARSADYLAFSGHNLATVSAAVTLQHSDDGVNYSDAFAPFTPVSDKAAVKEFPDAGPHRYWRLRIANTASAPFLSVCVWGLSTELDYASSGYDPHAEEAMASVNMSYGGFLAGAHTHYTERSMTLKFEDADAALYAKVRAWREGSGLKNFFVAWEISNSPYEVFLMRPEARFSNPFKAGGAFRDITMNLTGRKEQ